MHPDITSKLNAYVDGELSAQEGSEIEALAASNSEVRDKINALKEVRSLLQNAEPAEHDVDAAWQKFSKDLPTHDEAISETGSSLIRFPARWGAIAALLTVAAVLWLTLPKNEDIQITQNTVDLSETVELVQTDIEDSEPIVYIDSESGWTIVWIETSDATTEPIG